MLVLIAWLAIEYAVIGYNTLQLVYGLIGLALVPLPFLPSVRSRFLRDRGIGNSVP